MVDLPGNAGDIRVRSWVGRCSGGGTQQLTQDFCTMENPWTRPGGTVHGVLKSDMTELFNNSSSMH